MDESKDISIYSYNHCKQSVFKPSPIIWQKGTASGKCMRNFKVPNKCQS